MTDLDWFVAVSDWEYDHLETPTDRLDPCLWQAIAARLLGFDKR